MSPARNGSTALQRFERGNAIAIRNGIMFDFYPGLPHIILLRTLSTSSSLMCLAYTHTLCVDKSDIEESDIEGSDIEGSGIEESDIEGSGIEESGIEGSDIEG